MPAHLVMRLPCNVAQRDTFPAKHGRTGFRRNSRSVPSWRGRWYGTEQIEAFAVRELDGWLVITGFF